MQQLSSSNSLGIICGLVLGKTVGIVGFCLLATCSANGAACLQVCNGNLIGAAMFGGIGFTMSIFIYQFGV